jgi:regulator of protease activity HflC (stomatin/prohibitin superfamily)
MIKSFLILKNERGALLKDGDFERLLPAGKHYVFDPSNAYSVQKWKIDAPMADLMLVDYVENTAPARASEHFIDMKLGDGEVGLRYENDLLAEIVPPAARRVFVRGLVTHRLERISLSQHIEVDPELVRRYMLSGGRNKPVIGLSNVLVAQVPAYQVGILTVDGKVDRLLEPGISAYWKFNREVSVEMIDLRLQTVEVSGQEILSSDKVGLRLNLIANWRYSDVLLAHTRLMKPAEQIYRELQFGLRAAVGTRSVDQLLENKEMIDRVVMEVVTRKMSGFGIELLSVGVRDIVLPGEMKAILGRVVEAQKAAEANVIRRREETAATRSLLNTARVMEDNPVALRLKELETLERVAERIDRISVFGGLDQVLNGLVSLR